MITGTRRSRLIEVICWSCVFGLVPFSSSASEIGSANVEFSKGNYIEAISLYASALNTIEDKDGAILYRIALCYMMAGKQAESVKYFGLAKQRNPKVFNGRIYKEPSGGMKPTLLLGDHIIVDREFYTFSMVKRFDVVVLKQPGKEDNLLIKRIVGLPGEKVEIRNRVVYVDGKELKGDTFGMFDIPPIPNFKERRDFEALTIPEQSYFMLGDNRNASFDSRHFGSVKEESIVGKVLVVYGSIDSTQQPPLIREDRIGLVIK